MVLTLALVALPTLAALYLGFRLWKETRRAGELAYDIARLDAELSVERAAVGALRGIVAITNRRIKELEEALAKADPAGLFDDVFGVRGNPNDRRK